MSPELFARASAQLDALLELPAAERVRALELLQREDPTLAREVGALLAWDQTPSGPLERPLDGLLTALDGGGAPAAQDAVAPGQRFGPYRIVGSLGRGGMGEVFLAARDDGEFRQQVAIKRIKRGMDTDEVLARFRAERQMLAGLVHPAIARLLDGGATADGRPYFALEYVAGVPLTRYCWDHAEHGLGLDGCLRLFLDVCRAVEFAHRQLIVHRDLKPSNVLVTAAGEVKLLDFGIAKWLGEEGDASVPATAVGRRVLTPEYAAPEQLAGAPVTTATDVYGLGAVLWEVLTGERVPPGHRPPLQLAHHALPRSRRRELETLLTSALHADPERRYPTATALREDLERFLAGRPLAAHPDSHAYRLRRFVARHRVGVGLGALALVSLLAGLAVALWQARVADREVDRQRQVLQLWSRLFEGVEPDRAKGDQLTVRELLDRGALPYETEEPADPALAADLLGLLGELYTRLGALERAEGTLERALTLHRRHAGPAALPTARTEFRLARVERARGRLAPAAARLHRALAAFEAHGDHELAAQTLGELAELEALGGSFPAAAARLETALTRLASRGQGGSGLYADLLAERGALAAMTGDFARASADFERALHWRRTAHGELHSTVSAALASLAAAREGSGRAEEAVGLLREAAAIDRRLFGADSLRLATVQTSLGALLCRHGAGAEAAPLLAEALAVRQRRLGNDNPFVAVSHHNLGRCLTTLGRAAEALPHLERAVVLARQGGGGPGLAQGLESLADAEFALGQPAAGREHLAEALRLFTQLFGPDHPRTREVATRAQL